MTIQDGNITDLNESAKDPQGEGGILLAVEVLVGIAVIALLFCGVADVFFPNGHSRTTGWMLLFISTAVIVITMNRWVRYLPGIFGLAALNGLILTLSGHIAESPSTPVPRLTGLIFILLFLAGATLSSTFKGRELHLCDRIALMAFILSFTYAGILDSPESGAMHKTVLDDSGTFIAAGIGLCCLFIAWAYDHFRRKRPREPNVVESQASQEP